MVERDGGKAEDNSIHGEGQEEGGRGVEEEEEGQEVDCRRWPPPRRQKPLHVALAASILSTEQGLLHKTLRAAYIARILLVFRVDKVVVYRDRDSGPSDDRDLAFLLEYFATPPYLRRRVFPLHPLLKYVGAAPPARGPLHDAPQRPVKGAVVAGLVESCEGRECTVYLGRLGRARVALRKARPGAIVPLRIVSRSPLKVEPAPGDIYTGYRVSRAKRLADTLERYRSDGFLVLGTSRYGECVDVKSLASLTKEYRGVTVVVGGPRGNVVRDAGTSSIFHAVLNTIPLQGSRTVRTEEALLATLAILNTVY